MAYTPVIVLAPDAAGQTVEIDGVTYHTLLLDGSGGLVVAVGDPFAPTSVGSGQKTVTSAGTPEALPSQACKAVSIAALPDNGDNVYVGSLSVSSSSGRVLAAGDAIDIAVDNLNRLYIDADTNGEGVSYLWVA